MSSENSAATRLESALSQIRVAIIELREVRDGGRRRVAKYCNFIREEIEIVTETKLDEMRRLCQSLLDEVDSYQNECNAEDDEEDESAETAQFEQIVADSSAFETRCNINEMSASEMDATLIRAKQQRTSLQKLQYRLKAKQFNEKRIKFKCNEATLEGSLLGHLEFETYRLRPISQLEQLQFTFPLRSRINKMQQLECLDNGNYLAAYEFEKVARQAYSTVLCLFDPAGKCLSTSINGPIQFQRLASICHFENRIIFSAHSMAPSYSMYQWTLNVVDTTQAELPLEMQVKSYLCHFTSLHATSDRIYGFNQCYSKSRLYIYNWKLELLTHLGQSIETTSPFYIRCFASQMQPCGRQYLVKSDNNLVFFDKESGLLERSFRVVGEEFLVNSRREVIVLCNRTRRVVGYNFEGKCLFLNELYPRKSENGQSADEYVPVRNRLLVKLNKSDDMFIVDLDDAKLYSL